MPRYIGTCASYAQIGMTPNTTALCLKSILKGRFVGKCMSGDVPGAIRIPLSTFTPSESSLSLKAKPIESQILWMEPVTRDVSSGGVTHGFPRRVGENRERET